MGATTEAQQELDECGWNDEERKTAEELRRERDEARAEAEKLDAAAHAGQSALVELDEARLQYYELHQRYAAVPVEQIGMLLIDMLEAMPPRSKDPVFVAVYEWQTAAMAERLAKNARE